MTLRQPPDARLHPPQFAGRRFVSLRTKFVVFFSLILILTCSALSGYFLETRRAVMTGNLHQLGTILLTSVVNNRQFRYGGLIAEDRATLQQFTDSLIAVEDVVYVVIRGTDGLILAQQNKLVRESSGSLTFTQERRYYPDEQIAQTLYRTPVQAPQMTPVALSEDKILVPDTISDDWFFSFSPLTEHVYDFAMPVLRQSSTDPSLSPLPLQFEDMTAAGPREPPVQVQGVVQIGMSDAHAMQSLLGMIRNTLLLTGLIIGIGILGAHVLTMRITTPIRSLAAVARQLAEGKIPPPLPPTTHDEVGQLTGMFNMMTQALHERNLAINTNLEIIQRQVLQLSAVHQTSAAITSTLNLHQLLDTVLQLLITNLGFSRMLLLLRRDAQDIAYIAQIAGVSPEIMEAARLIEIPIEDGDTLLADLLIHAKPVHVHQIESVRHRMHPAMLQLAHYAEVTSFVAVPLQIHGRTLGVLVGDRNALPCTGEDLSILETIAGHVAAAIDNARAYADLTELTQYLEQRIQARTRELSVANERLQDHDRRRSMFVSVASHELRTPMTAIRSFADNMRDGITGPLTERQSTYLNRIGYNLDRLTRIINQLLDWSRLDLHKDSLRMEPLCIQQTTHLVVDSLQHLAAQKKVCLAVEHSERTPPIAGDRDKVEQILWNLLGNAVKFTPPEGRVTVEFTATADRFVQITVTDTGCGIQPEDLPKIFNEFSKVASAMPGSQGAQLGLCITKTLITMHGGSIRVESTPGVGTTVVFTLPVADPQPVSADDISPADSFPDIERGEP
jgi:two-component system sensor histidine kinase/response regulator